MVRRGNLAVLESSGISETREVTPTKIGVHVCEYSHNHVTALPVLPLLNDSSLLVCSSQPFQLV